MMSAIWLMTVPVGPFLALGYKTTRASTQYKIRNIQSLEPDTELRILTYTHTSINVSGVVDLLEASNPSRQSQIYVIAVQLVELTGQASAMLIVHNACKVNTNHTWANTEAQPESFTSRNAFESYAKGREIVYVQALTTVSAYNTMHEDQCLKNRQYRRNIVDNVVILGRRQSGNKPNCFRENIDIVADNIADISITDIIEQRQHKTVIISIISR